MWTTSMSARTSFGLGAILCEILTGMPPYSTESSEDALRQAKKGYLNDALVRLRKCDADPEITDLARRCLSLESAQRPRDAGAVAQEVASYLQSLETRARVSEMEVVEAQVKVREERKARRLTVALAVTGLLALVLGGGGYVWIETERREAATAATLRFERTLTRARTLAGQASAAGGRSLELWAAAREASQRAGSLVPSDADPEVRAEVAALAETTEKELRSRRVLAQLEEIRDQYLYPGIDQGYAGAFREILGEEVFEVPEDDAVTRIVATGIAKELALALDDWALVRKSLGRSYEELGEISQRTDATRWRVLLWEAVRVGSEEAVGRFVASLGESDSPAAVLCVLADSLRAEGKVDIAEVLLRRAVRLDPSSYRANRALGRLLSGRGAEGRVDGLRYLMAAMALRPRSVEALSDVARAQFLTGDLDEAIFTSTKLFTGLQFVFWSKVGESFLDMGRLEASSDALEALRDAITRNLAADESPDSNMWELLGVVLASRYAPDEAEKALEFPVQEVERTERRNPFVLNMLARVQFGVGRQADAIRTLEEALTLTHSNPAKKARWTDQLRRYREAVFPNLVSYASVDAALAGWDPLVPQGAEWRYFVGVQPPSAGTEWASPDFDDSSWSSGSEGFGDGDDDKTVLAEFQNNQVTVYIRRWLEVPDPARFSSVELSARADDGFTAYLGGQLIGSVTMEPGLRGNDARATNAAAKPVHPMSIDLTGKLEPGRNLIAIRCANLFVDSSDFSLFPRVVARPRMESDAVGERVESFRHALAARNARALLAYLEGKLLVREGDHKAAAAKFREVLALDRKSPEPFLALRESLMESLGVEAADRLIRSELQKEAPTSHLQLPVRKPRNLVSRLEGLGVRLETGPFDHPGSPRLALVQPLAGS